MNRAELRREFPNEPLPAIVRANGSVSLSAIRTWFSAMGCPHGVIDVTAAAIKSGLEVGAALQLGMLAYYRADLSTHCIERVTAAMLHATREAHAAKFPWGKEAEDRAARIEGRASRWGTDDFHRWNARPVRTNYYPCAPFGPVQP